jgi:hypothetical protein
MSFEGTLGADDAQPEMNNATVNMAIAMATGTE